MLDNPEGAQVALTEAFITEVSGWLSPADAPAVGMLRILARELDANPTAALASSYRLTYNDLLKRQPSTSEHTSPLAQALADAREAA